jgi:hypothetical protein
MLRLSIGLFIAAVLVQLVVCNTTALKTQELHALDQEIALVQSQISEINQQIYLSSAISGMEARAHTLGFLPMDKPVNSVTNPTIARAF